MHRQMNECLFIFMDKNKSNLLRKISEWLMASSSYSVMIDGSSQFLVEHVS